jgi:hypothetical protein
MASKKKAPKQAKKIELKDIETKKGAKGGLLSLGDAAVKIDRTAISGINFNPESSFTVKL